MCDVSCVYQILFSSFVVISRRKKIFGVMNPETRTGMDRKSNDVVKTKSEDNLSCNIIKPKSDVTVRRRNSFNASVNKFKMCRTQLSTTHSNYLKHELRTYTHINERHPDQFRRLNNFGTNVRALLLDWMMEVCSVYRMQRATFHLAMDFLDRFAGRTEAISTNKMQLMGVTCIFTAAKLLEAFPPPAVELASLTLAACEAEEIKTLEVELLSKLQWDMLPKTLTYWLCRYLSRWCHLIRLRNKIRIFPKLWDYVFKKSSLIIDLCSLDEGILLYPYSYTVAAVLFYTLSPEKTFYVSGLTYEQLKNCLSWIAPFIVVANQQLLAKFFYTDNDPFLENIRVTHYPNVETVEACNIQTYYVNPVLLHDVYNYREQGISGTEN